jgi:hypothetical protein
MPSHRYLGSPKPIKTVTLTVDPVETPDTTDDGTMNLGSPTPQFKQPAASKPLSKFERIMQYRKEEERKARANLKKIKQMQSPGRAVKVAEC